MATKLIYADARTKLNLTVFLALIRFGYGLGFSPILKHVRDR